MLQRRVMLAVGLFWGAVAMLPAQTTKGVVLQSGSSSLVADAVAMDDAAMVTELLDDPQDKGPVNDNDAEPAGVVPEQKGFNASLNTTSQHDAAAGWQSILTPNVAYRFNKHFSVNLGLPVYTYQLVSKETTQKVAGKAATTVDTTVARHDLLGDTNLTGELALGGKWMDYSLSGSLGMPTGDDADGLGAGQFTYAFTNHFEHEFFDWFTPDIELGIGDSPNLDDDRLRKSYTTVGTGAHFQAGFSASLWKGITFDSEAYEDMPLGTQTVTSVTTNGKKGKNLRLVSTSTQKSIGEDNGFLNTLDIPIKGHIVLSGIYNHSLRDDDDTAGFAITFLLKAAKK